MKARKQFAGQIFPLLLRLQLQWPSFFFYSRLSEDVGSVVGITALLFAATFSFATSISAAFTLSATTTISTTITFTFSATFPFSSVVNGWGRFVTGIIRRLICGEFFRGELLEISFT